VERGHATPRGRWSVGGARPLHPTPPSRNRLAQGKAVSVRVSFRWGEHAPPLVTAALASSEILLDPVFEHFLSARSRNGVDPLGQDSLGELRQ